MVCLVHRVYGGICTRAEARLVLHQKFLKFIERHRYKLEIFQPLLICIVSVEGPWKCQSSPLEPHDVYAQDGAAKVIIVIRQWPGGRNLSNCDGKAICW